MAKYGGWETWETWQMAMVLDASEDLEEFVTKKIHEESLDELSADSLKYKTGQLIYDYIGGQFPELDHPWDSFFQSAIEKVNWTELAERFLKNARLLSRKGRKIPKGPREWSP